MKSYHRWIWEGERWPEFEYSVPDLKEVYYRFGRLKTVETLLGRSVNEALMAQALEDEAVATSIIEGEYLQRSSVRASVQKALKLEPDSAFYIDSLAWGHYKLGECKKAYTEMQKVIKELGLEDKEIKSHWNKIQKCRSRKK
jgi:hypothetical protein